MGRTAHEPIINGFRRRKADLRSVLTGRACNGNTGMAIAVMVLHHYGAVIAKIPTPAELMADWGVSRATAYRWHNSLARGAVHGSSKKRAKKLKDLMPNWPAPGRPRR